MSTHDQDEMARALGASRVVAVQTRDTQGPLGLLALGEEIRSRLRSSGGRPSDPRWTERRGIPFRREVWKQLTELAKQMSTEDRTVTAAQLAALLIERGLEQDLAPR
jgi:hypothetical protein